jgi:hypothetical protein
VPIDLTVRYVWIQLRAGQLVFPFKFEQTITHIPKVTSQSTYTGRMSEQPTRAPRR